jgi:23S rRNA pseudouridine1911/1915/1917 synthase
VTAGGQPGPDPAAFPLRLAVAPEAGGRRLDAWLAEVAGLARAESAAMIEAGLVTVDGAVTAKAHRVVPGEQVIVERRPVAAPPAAPAPFRVVLEDEYLAVIAKPAGVVVHPAPGAASGTLVEALASAMPLAPAAGASRPGIVHRLDRGTSGLLVVAKTDAAYRGLVATIGRREVEKGYLALVAGSFGLPAGRIEAPMARSSRDRTRMAVSAGGREAVTIFRVLEAFRLPEPATLLHLELHTGRTHQIRVHLAHIHRPVAGDPTYGRAASVIAGRLGLARPFLHAERLAFDHPVTGARVDVTEPLPADLQAALQQARRLSLPGDRPAR